MSSKRMQPDILLAAQALALFTRNDLTMRVSELEESFAGATMQTLDGALGGAGITHDLLASAYVMKKVAGQINVVIHAIGILLCLPHILEPGERVLSLSLGAGNTGREFDLETDRRIGEFKFIHWQGGPETIRQNALFKDLYQMIEHPSAKKKFMYVLGTDYPIRFLTSGRALRSVMSRNNKLWAGFLAKYGDGVATVGEYYALKGEEVTLVDVSSFVSALSTGPDDGKDSDESEAGAS
jgi:hypothetical protein